MEIELPIFIYGKRGEGRIMVKVASCDVHSHKAMVKFGEESVRQIFYYFTAEMAKSITALYNQDSDVEDKQTRAEVPTLEDVAETLRPATNRDSGPRDAVDAGSISANLDIKVRGEEAAKVLDVMGSEFSNIGASFAKMAKSLREGSI